MKVYKVLQAAYNKEGNLVRASVIPPADPKYWTYYQERTDNLPPIDGSFLYAFRSENAALKYCNPATSMKVLTSYGSLQVWECDAQVFDTEASASSAWRVSFDQFWFDHWYAVEQPTSEIRVEPDSIWCRSIRLRKMIAGGTPAQYKSKYKEPKYAD